MATREIAVLVWTDCTMHGPEPMAEADAKALRPVRGTSCGLIVGEGKEYITLALDGFGDGEYRGVVSYFKPQVHKIVKRKVRC